MDSTEIDIPTITWRAPEYLHKEKNVDFFWTMGIITLVGVGIALWTTNYLFAVFILIAGFCLIFFTIRPPELVDFTIESSGFSIGRQKFIWKSIDGFNIKKGEPYTKLIIKTTQKFLPILMVPVPSEIVSEIQSTLQEVIPTIEVEESRGMLFMEKIGF